MEFDFGYLKENPSDVVPFVKCLWTDTDDFYLSLDPYDERESLISDKDNDFFRSRSVKLTVQISYLVIPAKAGIHFLFAGCPLARA